jgi:hypothetical protein
MQIRIRDILCAVSVLAVACDRNSVLPPPAAAGFPSALVEPTPITVCRLAADSTGVEDATEALRDAVACALDRGDVSVMVPAGTYRISEPIVIPERVALVGRPDAALPSDGSLDAMPTLRFPAGFPEHAITLEDRASLAGLHVTFDGPQPAERAAIVVRGTGMNVVSVRVSHAGIGIFGPPEVNAGRVYINRVEVVDAVVGVRFEFGLDCARFENLRVRRTTPLPESVGFAFGQFDFMMASELSTSGVALGLDFHAGPSADRPVGSIATLTGLRLDGCTTGVSIGSTSRISLSGAAIDCSDRGFVVRDVASLAVTASTVRTVRDDAFALEGGRATLTVAGSRIDRSDPGSGAHGVALAGGESVTITGNTIASHGHGVFFHVAPVAGVVAGNTFALNNPPGRGVMGDLARVTVAGNASNQ